MGITIIYRPEEEDLFTKGVFSPVITCDSCGSVIEDMALGAMVLDNRSEACPQEPRFAHKGKCHDKIEAEIDKSGGNAGWSELHMLPARLANNMNPDWPAKKYRVELKEDPNA